MPQVRSASINNIATHVGNEIYDQLVSKIQESAASNIDNHEGEPFDDFVDTIYDEIYDVLNNMISEAISEKLYKENIEWLDETDFDIDTIISDEVELYDLIRDKCSIYCQSEDLEYNDKRNIEKEIIDVIEMFESSKFFIS